MLSVAIRRIGAAVLTRDLRFWNADDTFLREIFRIPFDDMRDPAGAYLDRVAGEGVVALARVAAQHIDEAGWAESRVVETRVGVVECRASAVQLPDTSVIHLVAQRRRASDPAPGEEADRSLISALADCARSSSSGIPSRKPDPG